MTTSRQIEPSVNNALGNLLRGMMPTCTVRSENAQTFADYHGRHTDVLVTATGRSPVAVEAEIEPAPEAEKDARDLLALHPFRGISIVSPGDFLSETRGYLNPETSPPNLLTP